MHRFLLRREFELPFPPCGQSARCASSPLEALGYRLGLAALVIVAEDANTRRSQPEVLFEITPRTIDLTPLDDVRLGSPVWLCSPAPPIQSIRKSLSEL